MSIGVIVKAKNEERNIGLTLKYIFRQTLKPVEVVVVNDGSTDRTGEIAKKAGATVIDLPDVGVYAVSLPHLAHVINVGLKKLENLDLDYVCIMDADHILPKYYFEKIVKRMQKDSDVVVASGIIKNEPTKSFAPRGTGRVVDVQWWKKYGFRYPYYYGWETWLVFRALKDGLKVAVYRDLVTLVLRPTRLTPTKYYRYGLSMKALGYWFPYVLGRAIVASRRNPLNGLMLLKGYLMPIKKYSDLDSFVGEFLRRQVLSSIKGLL